MRKKNMALLGGAVALALAGTSAVLAPQALAEPDTETENREVFSPDGSITRADVEVPVNGPPAPAADVNAAEVVPIMENGPSEEKFDIVVVGDGYTAEEMTLYEEHTRSKIDELFAVEPFTGYQDLFNVWMVQVVSNESGVDNDPDEGVDKDTALDMHFYCGGMERLLCADDAKAHQFAEQAPESDQVLALANSEMYGGAGGDIATASGGHADSGQIVVHELGHTIGGLADEYDYGEEGPYEGPEPEQINVSIHDRETQEAEQLKWHEWMGEESPDGGIVDTYEGAHYHTTGIFRPTEDSIMRTLGKEFNLPGQERMIAAFHEKTAGASTTVDTSQPVDIGTTLRIDIPQLPALQDITWTVDGEEVATGQATLGTSELPDDAGEVTVTVVDTTEAVRDEAARAESLTTQLTWQLS